MGVNLMLAGSENCCDAHFLSVKLSEDFLLQLFMWELIIVVTMIFDKN